MHTIRTWCAWASHLLVLVAIVVAAPGCGALGDVVRTGVWIVAIQMAVVTLLASGVAASARTAEGNRRGERRTATKDRGLTSRR
jgi:hypothetical protein